MTQPPGFIHPQHQSHVCKLHKALYGLKQAPRAWFSRLSSQLIQLGFISSRSDTSLFISRSTDYLMLVLIYVDNIIITCSRHAAIQSLLRELHNDFAVKDLGPLNYFLGIQVMPCNQGIILSQQ
jgi:histone deacetylase 1/2